MVFFNPQLCHLTLLERQQDGTGREGGGERESERERRREKEGEGERERGVIYVRLEWSCHMIISTLSLALNNVRNFCKSISTFVTVYTCPARMS